MTEKLHQIFYFHMRVWNKFYLYGRVWNKYNLYVNVWNRVYDWQANLVTFWSPICPGYMTSSQTDRGFSSLLNNIILMNVIRIDGAQYALDFTISVPNETFLFYTGQMRSEKDIFQPKYTIPIKLCERVRVFFLSSLICQCWYLSLLPY